MSRGAIAVGAAVLIVALAAACGSPPPSADIPATAAPVVAGGVRVSATMESATVVRVRLAPLRRGFHLYSLDLPDGGVDGLGIPTRIAAGAGLRSLGAPTTDLRTVTLSIESLGVDLPVYPDGPVDVRLPAETTGTAVPMVVVSYGACSRRTCLIPVHDLVVPATAAP